jgi:hypothetical protein
MLLPKSASVVARSIRGASRRPCIEAQQKRKSTVQHNLREQCVKGGAGIQAKSGKDLTGLGYSFFGNPCPERHGSSTHEHKLLHSGSTTSLLSAAMLRQVNSKIYAGHENSGAKQSLPCVKNDAPWTQ